MTDIAIPLKGQSLTEIFAGTTLTDQHGQPFDPATLFKDGQCLVLFGYEGCPMCQEITDSVAEIQQKLLEQGKDIPIVVISVQPEDDRDKMKTYIGSYYVKGVKQFRNETLLTDSTARRKLGESYFKPEGNKQQAGRLLHVVCPKSKEEAQELQKRIELMINEKDEEKKQHSSFISLFDKGKAVIAYRGLPGVGRDPVQYRARLASDVATDIDAAQHGRPLSSLAQPPQKNTLLWNLLVPTAAGLGTGLIAGQGSFSLTAILTGLIAAAASSFATQWFTESGVFEKSQLPVAPKQSAKLDPAPERAPDQDRAQQQAATLNLASQLAALQAAPQPATPPAPKSALHRG